MGRMFVGVVNYLQAGKIYNVGLLVNMITGLFFLDPPAENCAILTPKFPTLSSPSHPDLSSYHSGFYYERGHVTLIQKFLGKAPEESHSLPIFLSHSHCLYFYKLLHVHITERRQRDKDKNILSSVDGEGNNYKSRPGNIGVMISWLVLSINQISKHSGVT